MTRVCPIFLLTALFLLITISGIKAQDIIIKNNKEEVKAKVLEIEEYVIKYKKFEFLDGPTYSIRKSDVFMIIYKNGSRETFDNTPAPSNSYNQQQNTYNPNNSQYNNNQQQDNQPQPNNPSPQNNQRQTASQTNSNPPSDNTNGSDIPNCSYEPFKIMGSYSNPGDLMLFSYHVSAEWGAVPNWVNWGLLFGISVGSSDNIDIFTYSGGVFSSIYLPINRLRGNYENQETGFFPFFRPGISYAYSTIDTKDPVTYENVETSNSAFGLMLGLGLDWRLSDSFGLSAVTDMRALKSMPMLGIHFQF